MNLLDKAYNNNLNFVIALDGPGASGKGRIAHLLAEEFALIYVASGIVYRGLAYICLQENICAEDEQAIIELSRNVDLISRTKGVDLNLEIIGEFASKLSILPEVRRNLGIYLKKLIQITPRIIMEGRDVGTIIAPNADLKIFITASVEVRAMRRYKQLRDAGKDCILSDVLDLLKSRDERDMSRSVAPLIPASDAYIIDTTNLTIDQAIQRIKDIVSKSS
ncbi:MAG: (d)CMP kinase [Rickettsiaceae bacterium]|nr:(d)CMP kinase [Rickettsiaceae bacterium]